MKKNKKYLKAAQLLYIDNDDYYEHFDNHNKKNYACHALMKVNKSVKKFNELFKPENKPDDHPYWSDFAQLGVRRSSKDDPKQNRYVFKAQLARTMALLLMYEMGVD